MTDHYATRRGEARPYAKMTCYAVPEMRAKYALGGCSMASLGRVYGLSKSTVHAILTRRYWKHVP